MLGVRRLSAPAGAATLGEVSAKTSRSVEWQETVFLTDIDNFWKRRALVQDFVFYLAQLPRTGKFTMTQLITSDPRIILLESDLMIPTTCVFNVRPPLSGHCIHCNIKSVTVHRAQLWLVS